MSELACPSCGYVLGRKRGEPLPRRSGVVVAMTAGEDPNAGMVR